MDNRRTFIKTCMVGYTMGFVAVASPTLAAYAASGRPYHPITQTKPKTALVVWYSQTGHTERIGRIIRREWEKAGLTVDAADYREFEKCNAAKYDLIAIGTPVQYMDVPVNVQAWIKTLPRIEGASVASFVTFGGRGNGQRHAACSLLERMTQLGGAAAGMDLFGNMSTFAPTWSVGNEARILAFKDRPNEATYRQAREFANGILANVAAGRTSVMDREFGLSSLITFFPQIGFTKLAITNHHIDQKICIKCGTCVKKCPVGAINLQTGSVNVNRCIACIGCINNCPTQAMKMNFMGKPVYGFKEFLKRNRIEITEPA